MKINFYRADEYGCAHYRCRIPAKGLAQLGHQAEVRKTLFVKYPGGFLDLDKEELVDVYVLQRQRDAAVRHVTRWLRGVGSVVLYEIDDNIFNIPFDNPVGQEWNPQFNLANARDAQALMAECDGIICSTPELAREMKQYNPMTFVAQNCLDMEAWRPIERVSSPGKVVIGWSGSHTHRSDLAILKGVVGQVFEEYPQTVLATGGWQVAPELMGLDWLPPERRIYTEWVSVDQYPHTLAQFDIGLVPLVDNAFNACKSDLKGLEYSVLGVPFVATPCAAYRRLHKAGAGLLADKPKQWVQHLRRLIESADLRRELGEKGRAVAKARDIHNNAQAWEEIFTRVRQGAGRDLAGVPS